MQELKLRFVPSTSSISRLCSNAEKVQGRGLTAKKKPKPLASTLLDVKLDEWVLDLEARRLVVSEEMIRIKVVSLLKQVNERLILEKSAVEVFKSS